MSIESQRQALCTVIELAGYDAGPHHGDPDREPRPLWDVATEGHLFRLTPRFSIASTEFSALLLPDDAIALFRAATHERDEAIEAGARVANDPPTDEQNTALWRLIVARSRRLTRTRQEMPTFRGVA